MKVVFVMDAKKREELAEGISACIMQDNEKTRDNFYKFAKDGAMSFADAMLIWNGKPISSVDDQLLEKLFDFFSTQYTLRAKEYYFSEEPANQKQEFLASKDGQVYLNYKSVLSRMAKKIESAFTKDLCEVNIDELAAGLSDMNLTSFSQVNACVSAFREYVEWCYEKGYRCPAYQWISVCKNKEIVDKVHIEKASKRNFVSGPEDLEKIIKVACNFPHVNATGAVLMLLVWLGIPLERVLTLKQDEVSVQDGTVTVSGKQYSLPQTLAGMIREYHFIDTIYSVGGRPFAAAPTTYYIKRFFRAKNNSVNTDGLAKEADQPLDIRSARNTLRKIILLYNEQTGEDRRLTELSLKNSGMMWRLKEMEVSGTRITPSLISEVCGTENPTTTNSYVKLYKMFRKLFL